MTKLTPRDEGRVRRAVQGAGERAASKLRSIAAAREKAIQQDRDDPLKPKEGVPQHRWPLHSIHNTAPGQDLPPPLENHVTVARARQAAGLPLTPYDVRALERHPDPTPYERAMRKAAAAYQADVPQPDRSAEIAAFMDRAAAMRAAATKED